MNIPMITDTMKVITTLIATVTSVENGTEGVAVYKTEGNMNTNNNNDIMFILSKNVHALNVNITCS